MTFALSDEQQRIVEMVRALCAKEIAPKAREVEAAEAYPSENLALLGKQGVLGLLLPPPFGGAGQGSHTYLHVMEAVGRACPATAFMVNTHMAASFAILVMGSDDQKGRYLKALAEGAQICAMAGSEAGGGSTPMSIRTFARRDGDDYVLDGAKLYISGAGEAELYFIIAKTSQEPGPRSFGVFLVEKGTAGLSFGRPENKLGLRGLPAAEVVLEDCRVPAGALLGEEGAGLAVVGPAGGVAALGAGAMAMGMADGAVEATRAHLQERTIVGRKLGENEAVQLRFADMLTAASSGRAILHWAAEKRDGRAPDMVPAIFQAKIHATERALEVIDMALQLHGSAGYSRDLVFEKYYRDARALTIHFGTNDVLRANLSKMALGLLP